MLAARHGSNDELTEDLGHVPVAQTVEALIEAGADISLRNEVHCLLELTMFYHNINIIG